MGIIYRNNKIITPTASVSGGGSGGGEPNFAKYRITQIINGNSCELQITDINESETTNDNYFVGQNIEQNNTQLYIVDI